MKIGHEDRSFKVLLTDPVGAEVDASGQGRGPPQTLVPETGAHVGARLTGTQRARARARVCGGETPSPHGHEEAGSGRGRGRRGRRRRRVQDSSDPLEANEAPLGAPGLTPRGRSSLGRPPHRVRGEVGVRPRPLGGEVVVL